MARPLCLRRPGGGRNEPGVSSAEDPPVPPDQIRDQASVSTERRICSISSKWAWPQISGGASWTTGSPRSSARQ